MNEQTGEIRPFFQTLQELRHGECVADLGFALNDVVRGVRLRYRIKDATLSIWYELDRPAEHRKLAVEALTTSITKALGDDVPIYRGSRG